MDLPYVGYTHIYYIYIYIYIYIEREIYMEKWVYLQRKNILLQFQMSLASGGLIVAVQMRPMITQQEGLPTPAAIKKEKSKTERQARSKVYSCWVKQPQGGCCFKVDCSSKWVWCWVGSLAKLGCGVVEVVVGLFAVICLWWHLLIYLLLRIS